MRILKFDISGKSAFFKNNDVSDNNITFSFGQIHKVALMGILGAIIGLDGHNKLCYDKDNKVNEKQIHPDFYNKLKDMKVAITPNSKEGYFRRCKQEMVNTCGYSKNRSLNVGQTLIYIEQWLEDVSWTIYVDLTSLDSGIANKLEDYIMNNKCVYIPYLGKTNHGATIDNQSVEEAAIVNNNDLEEIKIDSLFIKDNNIDIISLLDDGLFDDIDDEDDDDVIFEYREVLPVKFISEACIYEKSLMVFTNKKCNVKNKDVLSVNDKNLIFI